jgi:hypothetical protein
VDGIRVRPREHHALPEFPLVVQRGQAAAYFLRATDGSEWILKKFHQGRCPNEEYLRGVSNILPRHHGFLSGTQRRVLTATDLRREPGCYYSPDLQRWLAGTVLMRRVPGIDWATAADEIREGGLQLSRQQRVALCRHLAELVQLMETYGCAHRDISSGNTFIDTSNWLVVLIDFDSTYHPTLAMPAVTTCGTEGYTHPFVWHCGTPRPEATWCPAADRFALTLVCVEFLVLDAGAPLAAEGGMFDQEQLRARSGPTLDQVRTRLRTEFQAAMPLFDAAIRSCSCLDCPAPGDWLRFCDTILGPDAVPPPLDDLENILPDYFARLLQRRVRAAPVWPAPHLPELPNELFVLPNAPRRVVPLPQNPWAACRHQEGATPGSALGASNRGATGGHL